MAIVDVEIPSGYIYTGWKFEQNLVSATYSDMVSQNSAWTL